ncbi:MAG: hypothetical protein HYY15_03195 [Candidatus Omnitrophica bacterium]|nr:hypothetical protein [Candidatus Omnitrophota bacterium]
MRRAAAWIAVGLLAAAPLLAAGAAETAEELRAAQLERAQLLSWRRDPFAQASTAQHSTLGFTLSGILLDAARPLAVVNGTAVAVGDEIEGFRVTEITAEQVVLTDGTQTYQLRLSP